MVWEGGSREAPPYPDLSELPSFLFVETLLMPHDEPGRTAWRQGLRSLHHGQRMMRPIRFDAATLGNAQTSGVPRHRGIRALEPLGLELAKNL